MAVHTAVIAVYCVFVADYIARLCLAQPRGNWFLRHLWELPIILLPFLRPLRLLSLAVVVKVLRTRRRPYDPGSRRHLHDLRCGCDRLCRLAGDSRGRTRPTRFSHQQFRRRTVVGDDDSDHGRVRRPVPGHDDRSPRGGGVDDRRHHPVGCRDGDVGVMDRVCASARRIRPAKRRLPLRSRSCARRFGVSRNVRAKTGVKWKVADDQTNCGVGHGLRRQDGDRRDRQAPAVRTRWCRGEQSRQGRPRRRRDLRPACAARPRPRPTTSTR